MEEVLISNLLSGLLGAVLGSLLTGLYMHYWEEKKLKVQFTMELINYIDDLYHHVMLMAWQPPNGSNQRALLSDDEYRSTVRNLTKISTSTKPQTLLDIISKNKSIIADFEGLRSAFKEAADACHNREAFMHILNEKVDPLYTKIHSYLVGIAKIN